MKHLALILSLLAHPVAAQDLPPEPEAGLDPDSGLEGFDMMQRGMESILRDMTKQLEPALDDMGQALTELRPMAEKLFGMIDDIGNYEAPVVLENGDILIRRKAEPPKPLKEGEIEL
ncbi:MAG: AAA+ family ATPase [Cereibacter sphaeroides]|uniref:AAA+ family ATPase n=1 Tax=Cereibacter sphaeroides TaxID=1063 RepID=A0A2W5UAU7_CERSP|nr:MAG: AAA+ family ATPase [Cereibacter sphaeroides]